MTDQFCGVAADKAFHDPLGLLGACLAKVLPEGPVGTALLWVMLLSIAVSRRFGTGGAAGRLDRAAGL